MESTTPDAIEPPATVLVLDGEDCDPDFCEYLHPDDERAELRISFASDPAHATAPQGDPARLGYVSIGDVLRSASADGPPDFTAPIVVDAVDDPTDLSAIGRSVSRVCEAWADRDERISVCFRSLDALLRHAPAKTVFGFVHVLGTRFSSVDAQAHVHFDTTAVEDATVATFGTLFDAVVCADGDPDGLPEATDEDVAATLDAWEDDAEGVEQFDVPDREATDEEIARLLER